MAKILTLLVLLMTAVTGAVAQSYEAKVFDLPASWASDETILSPADMPEDFVQITKDEAKALTVPDGYVYLIYGFNGDNVKVMEFDSGFYMTAAESQKPRGNFIGYQTDYNAIICYTAAPSAESSVTVTEITKNQWQFTMPAYDVELEMEYETALALNETTDNTAALTEWNGYEADVTMTRTLQAGGWNTFCVPFSMAIPSGWTVKELSTTTLENGTLTLNFAGASSIVAGKPYLVRVTANVENPTFDGVIISKTAQPTVTTYANFVPVFGPTNLQGGNKNILFVTGGNTLTYPAANGNINGFRAYFLLHDAAAARTFALNFEDATGIETIDYSPLNTDQSVYDLQGRRMANGQSSTVDGQSLKKGVYIVNGKKTVIK